MTDKPINPVSPETYIATGCRTCTENSENCCVGSYVPLTIRDIMAIEELGYDLEYVLQVSEYFPEYMRGDEEWWRDSTIAIDGRLYRMTTRKDVRGKCVFLKEGEGCLLGTRRPAVCKIYPFWVDNRNVIVFESGEEDCCPIAAGAHTVEEGIRMIDESPGSIREYYYTIKQDCLEQVERHRELVERFLSRQAVL